VAGYGGPPWTVGLAVLVTASEPHAGGSPGVQAHRVVTARGDDPVGLYAWTPTRVWFGGRYQHGEPYGPRWTSVPRHPGLPGDE